jgi:hypothetical protein
VQIDDTGWGNHCNYATVPNAPQITARCAVPGNVSVEKGHYDSVYGLSHFNLNSAAGWGNIQFSGNYTDTWFCRGYVDTNGNQNPSPFCS